MIRVKDWDSGFGLRVRVKDQGYGLRVNEYG